MRGAFTGAVSDRVGRFQLADRGTLFLDEVGEIPLELQTKLLLRPGKVSSERVGDASARHVAGVRVIAATNRDLRAEVEAGHFRLDLFYRLSVFPMQVPPCESGERISSACDSLPDQCQPALRPSDAPSVSARNGAVGQLRVAGNIRELQHVVERALILSGGRGSVHFDVAAPEDTTPATDSPLSPERRYRTEAEWRNLERATTSSRLSGRGAKSRARASGAATLLGVNPNTLASRASCPRYPAGSLPLTSPTLPGQRRIGGIGTARQADYESAGR